MRSAAKPGPKGTFWRQLTSLAIAAILLAADAQGQAATETQAASNLITSIHQFWNLTPEERTRAHPFRIECDVSLYDPTWKNLWVQDSMLGAYVSLGNRKLPIKSGQHIVLTGTFAPPNLDISFEHATVMAASPGRIEALRAGEQFRRSELYANKVISIEAFVVRQNRVDPEHLHLTLSIQGETVFAYVLLDVTEPVPDFEDASVRLRGVYVPHRSGGNGPIELRIAGVEDVTVIHRLATDPRFKLTITPIAKLGTLPRKRLVKLSGRVEAQEPGRYLRIRDNTGAVELLTGQMRELGVDEEVEAIGYPAVEGTGFKLQEALYRSLATPLPSSQSASGAILRVAVQVLELPREEAEAGRRVVISGVVTWSDPTGEIMFIQDASGGVGVSRGAVSGPVRAPGENVEVKGVTTMGSFAPIVEAEEITGLGNLPMPGVRQASLETALTGVEEAQWVEMRGYLRNVEIKAGLTQLELTTSAGNFLAQLSGAEDLSKLEGTVIRLHGVCTAEADQRRKLTGIKLLVPSAAFIQVEETAPRDLFDQPARLLANLGQYGTLKSFNRRVKVSGVVLHHAPGRFINIVEGDESLMVLSRQTIPLLPGDRVDAVGFLGRQAGRPVLRESVYRKSGHVFPSTPVQLTTPAIVRSDLDGHLVRLEARLIDDSAVGDQIRLTLQSDKTIFEAYLEKTSAEHRGTTLQVGSLVRTTGVYETRFVDGGQAGGFLIRLRSPADIELLQRPSALTRGRVLTFSATLAVGILLFSAWVIALRRRVQQQTSQIREQLHREARLELELQRATKLESLGILAGGIAHDFNNLLTVVMGNISLAMLDLKKEAESTSWLREAERAVARARDLTQQLLTFSKGGAPIRSAVVLADVVQEVAQFALRGSNVRCVFDIAGDLWPADVDKGQIAQVVQNVVINAMQVMPEGGQIDIALRNELDDPGFGKVLAPGRYVKLTIADRGVGIAAENLGRIFEPYFTTKKTGSGLGLATVYSIVKKHLGHVSVESTVGHGTSFHIWLPAAAAAPELIAEEMPEVKTGRGRVLFMDDEEEIRRLGAAMLRRLGYDATTVSNGDEAVAEYRSRSGTSARFDVVVLDLTIPGGKGGCETMEELLRIDPTAKGIVSSGYSNDEVLSNHQSYGFSGMVTKPYQTRSLAGALKQVLQPATI